MALLTEKGRLAFFLLPANRFSVKTKGRCMPHCVWQSLLIAFRAVSAFGMPDRRKRVANILLINIGYRNLAEFRQNMMLKPGLNQRPASPSPFNSAFRLSNASIATSFNKCRLREASRLLAFALFDWIDVRANHGAPLFSGFTRLFQ